MKLDPLALADENENLAFENEKLGAFLELLGFSPAEITDLVVNGEGGFGRALLKVKGVIHETPRA